MRRRRRASQPARSHEQVDQATNPDAAHEPDTSSAQSLATSAPTTPAPPAEGSTRSRRDATSHRFSAAEVEAYKANVWRVIHIWQKQQEHVLSRQRLHEFRRHDAIAYLIDYDDVDLRVAARRTKAANGGALLLNDWLLAVKELHEERRRASERSTDILPSAPKLNLCPSCGTALGRLGYCRCSL